MLFWRNIMLRLLSARKGLLLDSSCRRAIPNPRSDLPHRHQNSGMNGSVVGIATTVRKFSSLDWRGGGSVNDSNDNSSEKADDFERRLFGATDDKPSFNSFYRRLDKVERSYGRSGIGSPTNAGGNSRFIDGLGESFDTLSDGMDAKLKKAANTFVYSDEIQNEDYKFRPDMNFKDGTNYTPRDLDLTKPGIEREFKRFEFATTTEEVLKKADFRNVRFLSNFLTEAGIIIKRSQTKISAKAQRKVAREIKTARAFGLMPFTTMGTKPFVFGKLMKDEDQDYEYDVYATSGMTGSAETVKHIE